MHTCTCTCVRVRTRSGAVRTHARMHMRMHSGRCSPRRDRGGAAGGGSQAAGVADGGNLPQAGALFECELKLSVHPILCRQGESGGRVSNSCARMQAEMERASALVARRIAAETTRDLSMAPSPEGSALAQAAGSLTVSLARATTTVRDESGPATLLAANADELLPHTIAKEEDIRREEVRRALQQIATASSGHG